MITLVVTVWALACSASEPAATTGLQQQSTAVAPERSETESTSAVADPSDQETIPAGTRDVEREPTPADVERAESVPSFPSKSPGGAVNIAESTPQTEGSDFQQQIGGAYPGLLTLPECSASTQLTVAPLDDDAYTMILPLGLLATPQWVLPSSHVYYQLARETSASGGYGPPAIADVRAPADIRILGVDSSESKGGPQGDYIDYEITCTVSGPHV